MQELLGLAVRNNIHPQFAQALARQQLGLVYDKKGGYLPVLEISILGTFSVKIADKTVLTIDDLTPAQRKLTALLLAEKNQQMNQEKIQLALWPESPPDKTRTKLDALVRRLRKVFDQKLPCPTASYLTMRKSMLCLNNCRIDGVEFLTLANEGLRHVRMENFWQAGNSFFKALQLWEPASSAQSDLFSGETTAWYDHLLNLMTGC